LCQFLAKQPGYVTLSGNEALQAKDLRNPHRAQVLINPGSVGDAKREAVYSDIVREVQELEREPGGPEYPLESALVRLRRGNSSEGLVRECARLGTRQPSFEMAAGTLARLGRVSLSATRCGDIIGGDQPTRKGVGGRAETAALYTPGG